jgi:hypothetical protein
MEELDELVDNDGGNTSIEAPLLSLGLLLVVVDEENSFALLKQQDFLIFGFVDVMHVSGVTEISFKENKS